uniref:PDZ domain-containing protein n=1 Tax=Cryptomonas curvata TaxID=233186 RepID=A0A7S0QML8_9CRYP
MGSPANVQYIPLTMTQPISSSPNPNYTTHIRALPLTVSQVVTRVAPATVETVKGTSPATFIKEIEVEERYEIVPVKSPPTLPQKKDAPQMINYEVPREPVSDSRDNKIRSTRGPKQKERAVERGPAPPTEPTEPEEEVPQAVVVPQADIVIRQHRIEVPVEFQRIVEKIIQVPVERIVMVDNPIEVDKIVIKEVTKTVEVPVERLLEREVVDERTVERKVEVPVERVTEVPVERVVEVPVERVVEKRVQVEYIVEVPVERIVEYPVERVVQVRREVYVEPKRVGLGLLLEQNLSSTDRVVVVKDVVAGFAADASGNVKPGDVILSIDGQSLAGKSLEQVKGLMMANAGTRSTLEIVRNEQRPFKVDVTRSPNIRSPGGPNRSSVGLPLSPGV